MRAASELMVERDLSEITMDALAERAQASKATIYRWWPSKELLVLDALRSEWDAAIPDVIDTGSLAEDLRALIVPWARELATKSFGRLIAVFIARAQVDPEFAREYLAHFVGPRRERRARRSSVRSARRSPRRHRCRSRARPALRPLLPPRPPWPRAGQRGVRDGDPELRAGGRLRLRAGARMSAANRHDEERLAMIVPRPWRRFLRSGEYTGARASVGAGGSEVPVDLLARLEFVEDGRVAIDLALAQADSPETAPEHSPRGFQRGLRVVHPSARSRARAFPRARRVAKS